MPLWRGRANTRTFPAILFTLPPSEAADMAHLCVPQNQAWGSTEDLFLASKYEALTGESILSTQPSHRTQKEYMQRRITQDSEPSSLPTELFRNQDKSEPVPKNPRIFLNHSHLSRTWRQDIWEPPGDFGTTF